jgi:hypothetical protein
MDMCVFLYKGFVRGSSRSVLLAFSQSYVEHDFKKIKLKYHVFANRLIFIS